MGKTFCCFCQHENSNNQELFDHIKCNHPEETIFSCSELSCTRSYLKFKTFKKHRLSIHMSYNFENKNSVSFIKRKNTPLRQEDNEQINVVEFNDNNPDILNNVEQNRPFENRELFNQVHNKSDSLDNNCNDTKSLVDFTLPEESNKFNSTLLIFISSLYNMSEIPRNKIDIIINNIFNLLTASATALQNDIQQILKSRYNFDDTIFITEIIENLTSQFLPLNTEQKRFTQFEKNGTFIAPESYLIGERKDYQQSNDTILYKPVPLYAQFIPISKVLKIFFEIPGNYSKVTNYIKQLEECGDDICTNFIQGSFWRNKKKNFGEKIVYPVAIYYDDYEVNNPLGSHEGLAKCGAVYFSILCLPPDMRSKLENIFLFLLLHTLDKKMLSTKCTFYKAIDELRFLFDHGIEIFNDNKVTRIYFSLELILGDNLGLHSLLGFNESFNSNHFCRFCMIKSDEISKIFNERNCTLRDQELHKKHLEKIESSKTGVKEPCAFNIISNYDMYENMSVDVMHDYLEGVCRYDIGLLLDYFINKLKKFTFKHLNFLITSFPFGKNIKNKPVEISLSNFKQQYIKISSAEMLTLINYLSLIIGHFFEEDNDYWNLYLNLKRIISIISSTVIPKNTHLILEVEIQDYLLLRNKLFPNTTKPKHHFMIHHPRIMKRFGPLWNFSSMRFESKHHEGKLVANSAINRINICSTIALRHQLKLNYYFMKKEQSTSLIIDSKKNENLKNISPFFLGLVNEKKIKYCLNWIKRDSLVIQRDTIVMIPSESNPIFHRVANILVQHNDEIILLTNKLKSVYYCPHFDAFKVVDTNDTEPDFILAQKIHLRTTIITSQVLTPQNIYYIPKTWM